jgi:hypothetical protein
VRVGHQLLGDPARSGKGQRGQRAALLGGQLHTFGIITQSTRAASIAEDRCAMNPSPAEPTFKRIEGAVLRNGGSSGFDRSIGGTSTDPGPGGMLGWEDRGHAHDGHSTTTTSHTPHARIDSMPGSFVARQAVTQPTKPEIYLYELSDFLELPKRCRVPQGLNRG